MWKTQFKPYLRVREDVAGQKWKIRHDLKETIIGFAVALATALSCLSTIARRWLDSNN